MSKEKMLEYHLKGRGIKDLRVLEAMKKVPRERFIPLEYKGMAYEDYPLPIGECQTISQPYIVALMTELLNLKGEEKILEVGTGCGYQTAVLALLSKEVYSIELIESLALNAQKNLNKLKYKNIKIKIGNGFDGWLDYAPYDGIIVTCAPLSIPAKLIEQLKDQGRLVIPVGSTYFYQTLWLVQKKGSEIIKTNHGGVAFVPMVQ